MKIIKTVNWETADGRQIEVRIEVIREMQEETAYADGWNVGLGKKKYESLHLEVIIAGKFVTRSYQEPSVVVGSEFFGKDYIAKVESLGGYAVINNKIVLTKERYEEIMKAITEATDEAEQDEAYKVQAATEKAAEEEKTAISEAREKELKETEIPQRAVNAYDQYHGDAEEAWEDENETAWALIREWTPYIEAQHGMATKKLQKIMTESAREASFGINEA